MRRDMILFIAVVAGLTIPMPLLGQQGAASAPDLRTINPVCGKSPAAGKDVTQFAMVVLSRAASWPNSENLKWVAAVQKASGESPKSEIDLASMIAQRLNLLFGASQIDLTLSTKLLQRLGTLNAGELETWASGLTTAAGATVSKIDAALALVCVDRMFPNDRWNATQAATLRKRLGQVQTDVVAAFASGNSSFDPKRVPTDAPVALLLVNELFPAESFSRDAFDKALSKR